MSEDRKQDAETDAAKKAAKKNAEKDTQPAAQESQPEAAEAGAPETESEVDRLRAEAAEMKDRMLRAVAEAENIRRRSEKERQDAMKYGASSLAKEVLPVVDNLRRAIDAVPEEQRQENEALNNLVTGVEMTEKMLLDAFEKTGIRKIDPKGEKFSHAEHQAIQQIEGTGEPAGTVVEVLQHGYKLHDRLLRPAMVVVAKGDAAPPPEDGEKVDTTA